MPTIGEQSSFAQQKDETTETENKMITSLDKSIFPLNYFKDKKIYMNEIETKLNNEIGYRFWKRYINAAFWSYISMPINLSITMLTALSTGQATTNNLLPKDLYINISLATLVMSVLNTYFRPYIQMTKNMELMNKWNELGCQFESIMYSESKYLEHIEHRVEKYENLMIEVNELKKTETMDTQNFLTDSIYFGIRSMSWGLKGRDSWLSLDESYKSSEKHRTNISTQTPTPHTAIDPSAVCITINDSTVNDNHPSDTDNIVFSNPGMENSDNIMEINPESREVLTSLIKDTVHNISSMPHPHTNPLKLAKYRPVYKSTAL
jgi:hypothetical protein